MKLEKSLVKPVTRQKTCNYIERETETERETERERERERILFATALQAYQKGYKPI